MASTEERLARLEGQVQEQSLGFPELRDSIGRLGQRLDARIDSLGQRLDARIDSLEQRMDTGFREVNRRLDAQMTMLVGLLLAVITGFAATFVMR